jgi:hypothetical protein
VSPALGDLGDIVDGMLDDFCDHAASAVFHQNADSQSDLFANYSGATSLVGVAEAINKLRARFSQHIRNSKENDSAHPEYQLPGGILIHDNASLRFDLQNDLLPITASEGDPASIYAAIADFWRAYEAHRVADMHDSPDGSNTLPALTGIPLIHKLFLAEIADITPTLGTGQSTAATQLAAQAGFTET